MGRSVYRIKVEGHLDASWKEWFEGWEMSRGEDAATWLTGQVTDQPELHGVLARIRDLNLTLVFVHRITTEPAERGRNALRDEGIIPTARGIEGGQSV